MRAHCPTRSIDSPPPFSSTPRQLNHRKSPWHSLNRKFGGPWIQYGLFREQKKIFAMYKTLFFTFTTLLVYYFLLLSCHMIFRGLNQRILALSHILWPAMLLYPRCFQDEKKLALKIPHHVIPALKLVENFIQFCFRDSRHRQIMQFFKG
jgi:hypothetical protein